MRPASPKIPPPKKSPTEEADAATRLASELDAERKRAILGWRNKFAEVIIGVTQTWVGFIIVITISQIVLQPLGLDLMEHEYIALLASGTASVIGLAYILAKWLFPQGKSADELD